MLRVHGFEVIFVDFFDFFRVFGHVFHGFPLPTGDFHGFFDDVFSQIDGFRASALLFEDMKKEYKDFTQNFREER